MYVIMSVSKILLSRNQIFLPHKTSAKYSRKINQRLFINVYFKVLEIYMYRCINVQTCLKGIVAIVIRV